MVTITGEYQGDLHCTAVHGPSGTSLATDAPRDNQGRGEAFSPTDLVATGFATCIATTMAIAARRHGVEIGGISFEVTKEMSADAPRRISRLTARLRLPDSARSVPQGVLEKAANACPVHQSLAPSVEKVIELIWEQAPQPRSARP
jgi:putative redox protein